MQVFKYDKYLEMTDLLFTAKPEHCLHLANLWALDFNQRNQRSRATVLEEEEPEQPKKVFIYIHERFSSPVGM